jgi:UDP-N-acetylglucosamine 2-epimerase
MNRDKSPRLLSIIGTRPQYIKIKPLYDYCNLKKIEHIIVDTRQHYSDNVSKNLIEDLSLNVDISLNLNYSNEIEFTSKAIIDLSSLIKKEAPDIVLVYGDTNSTFCAAFSAYKLGVPVAHIEAGERCFDNSVPEEINRIFTDSVSRFNFCSSRFSENNIGGIFCGDLEYNLLNNIDPKIAFENFGVMTIHRQSNCSEDRLNKIFKMCSKIPYDIRFFAHHRIKPFISDVPKNVKILEPCIYSDMVDAMAKCKFIITDSGSIQKTSPFFGKNTLVMRERSEWKDTERCGIVRLEGSEEENIAWIMSKSASREKDLYLNEKALPAEIIVNTIVDSMREV